MKSKTTADHFDKKWSEIIKKMPKGGKYDFKSRSHAYKIICDNVKPGSKVFDYACGLGVIDKMLYEEKFCKVSGCDYSKVAIDYCNKTIKGDFRKTDEIFGYGYDVVLAVYFLEHIKDPVRWLTDTFEKTDRIITAIPRNFHKHGEHVDMAWTSWESFHNLFIDFKYKRLDLKKGKQFNTFKSEDNIYNDWLGGFAHPIVEFYK
jgi:hypothetical protein